ncbi:class I adenylate-forming enzyme family protein [Rhodococcus erythropolis]|uniref:class I adenylate-forming enzyme family protein n=1 Tax=Rhodococcus erythropolis TaxID=1833 RepID=UPI001BEAF388|nr:class I adenylate-forming enzyme family protein [Rhodococcus erythropolis]MBT2266109.1 acyl--CoA ligase [Rhodococcus erythropolis]
MTLHELFQAHVATDPSAEAVISGSERITYGELASRVDRIARGLHDHGVAVGDRVAVLAGNSPDVIAVYLAVGRLGAVYVPISSGFREREGTYVVANASPKVAIVESSMLSEFRSWRGAEEVPTVIVRDQPAAAAEVDGTIDFADLGRYSPEAPSPVVDANAPLLLCYTSGTTSTPKPVLHSQGSEVYNAQTYAQAWQLSPSDIGIVSLPLAWVYGLSAATAATLVSGGTVVLLERFHPVVVLDAIATHRATAIWGTMSMYSKLLEVAKSRVEQDISSLRLVVNGGEPCPPPLVAEFEKFTGLTLLGSYATSEARPILVVRPGDTSVPEGSSGQLVPGAEIKLVDPNGNVVPEGETGHALLRCPGLMSEYFREPELTRERMTSDGWLESGDLIRRDSNGYHFIVGRQSDMIIRSGLNIAPAEVESALLALPEIADAAVVGFPDRRSGEGIRAFVVTTGNVDVSEDRIRSELGETLASYKVPQEIIFTLELPRTPRGKVDKVALRSLPVPSGS